MKKIYTDDPNLPYKTTKLNALYSRSEIDGVFGRWGIKDVWWHWNPEENEIFVNFKIKENVGGINIDVSARVDCPVVWNKAKRNKAESINWNISMRVMFWYIKTHLEEAYLRQSSKAAAFLPDLTGKTEHETLKDILIPHLSDLRALTDVPSKKPIIIEEKD